MAILKLCVNDTVEMKKPHPCGSFRFKILRLGSDVRVCCLGCARDMTLDRVKLEKSIKKIVASESIDRTEEKNEEVPKKSI